MLEEENQRLKRMVADLSLDKQMLEDVIKMFYNPKRRHTHNDRVAPTVYEQRYLMNQESV